MPSDCAQENNARRVLIKNTETDGLRFRGRLLDFLEASRSRERPPRLAYKRITYQHTHATIAVHFVGQEKSPTGPKLLSEAVRLS